MSTIQDPLTHDTARVDAANRLSVFATSQSEVEHATAKGDAYNINTGLVAYTGSSESSLIYLKNNESRDLLITQFIIGLQDLSATVTDRAIATLIRNPIGGNIVSDATAVDMNINLNFGSSKVLDIDIFKGKDGGTISGGNDGGIFAGSGGMRLPIEIPMVIPSGSSFGLKIDLNTSGGGDIYSAIVCHLVDPDALA